MSNFQESDNLKPWPVSADLAWQATRYVWGELSPTEAAAFEDRLTTDPVACAAVAEAVTLSAGLQQPLSQPVLGMPTMSVRSSSSGRWWAIVACVGTALAAGISLMTAWHSPAVDSDLTAVELVSRWRAEGRFGLAGDPELRDEPEFDSEVLDESLSVPYWLLNAVELTTDVTPGSSKE